MSFAEFQLHPDLLKGVKELGFTRPTPIQSDAIPAATRELLHNTDEASRESPVDISHEARRGGAAHSWQPIAGAAQRRARGLQSRRVSRARRHRHRRARDRCRSVRPRRELRRAGSTGGLHSSRRRTARAEASGEAYTFAAPAEADELRAIERVVGKPLPRVTLPDFDYNAKPATKLEKPIAERLAEHCARRATERARSEEKRVGRAAPAKQTAPQSESAGKTPQRHPDGAAPSGERQKRRRRRRRR